MWKIAEWLLVGVLVAVMLFPVLLAVAAFAGPPVARLLGQDCCPAEWRNVD